jgi:hypothetical protein
LVGEVTLAKELNLSKSTWSDKPKDFYTFVGVKLKQYYISQLEDTTVELSEEDRASYRKLSSLDLFRSLIKQAIMTIPYNASALTIVDYIKESFEPEPNPDFNKEIYAAKLVLYKNKIINKKTRRAQQQDAPAAGATSVSERGTGTSTTAKQTRGSTTTTRPMLPVMSNTDKFYVYRLKSDPSIVFTELDFQNLRKALNIVIFFDYPKLKNLLEYLKTIANISNTLKIPIP